MQVAIELVQRRSLGPGVLHNADGSSIGSASVCHSIAERIIKKIII
jgi:hypothetical protein